ncbi:MAG: AI-2E family transporter [Methanoregula sp.]|jgi:predicted PurR-regulated permease PerM|nr:AI-2E family transporter [Methanoregula sp.]
MVLTEMSRVERSLLAIALLFIILIAVKMTAYIVTLILMSLIITMLVIPAQIWLKEKGLSTFASVLIISLAAGIVIVAFITLTALSLNSVVTDLPQYQQELNVRLADISAMLAPFGISDILSEPPSIKIGDVVSYGFSSATLIGDLLMFLFFVGILSFFTLLEVPSITARFEERFGRESATMQSFSRMTGYVIDFIVVRTETNFIHGVLFGGFLGVIGVHGAILWGTLTFILGYIPFFGLVIAAIPALILAWLQFGIPGAVAVVVVVCILNLIVENPVYSFLAARKFEMPALIVIFSVIFWGWLFGLVGMLFSVPFTLFILLTFQLSDELRWINVTLGVNHLFEEKGRKKGDE